MWVRIPLLAPMKASMNLTLIAAACAVIVKYGFNSIQVQAVLNQSATGWQGDIYAMVQRQQALV